MKRTVIALLFALFFIGLESCKKHYIKTYFKIEDETNNGVCSYWDNNPCLPYGFTYGQDYGPCTDQQTFMDFNYKVCNGPSFTGYYYFQPSNEEITGDHNIEARLTLHLTNHGIEPGMWISTVIEKTDESHPSEYTIHQKVTGGVLTIRCKRDTAKQNIPSYPNKTKH